MGSRSGLLREAFSIGGLVSETAQLNADPTTVTLAQAKEWLDKESRGSKGAACPCCNEKTKTLCRKVTPVHAAILVMLYRTYPVGAVVQLPDFVASLNNPELNARDIGRLIHWDLLEPTESEQHFRLCDGGSFFVFKGHSITEKAWIREDKVVSWEGKIVNLVKVLGTKFDINGLMSAPTPPVQAAAQ